jgi:hypothetical protein
VPETQSLLLELAPVLQPVLVARQVSDPAQAVRGLVGASRQH